MNRMQRRRQAAREKIAAKYCAERDAICRLLDVAAFLEFCRKNKVKLPKFARPNVPMATMHHARLNIRSFTAEEKLVSARWLIDNDYTLPDDMALVDGVLTGAEYNQ